jgi:hypothetical protein
MTRESNLMRDGDPVQLRMESLAVKNRVQFAVYSPDNNDMSVGS